MKTKTYNEGCKWCNATGYVSDGLSTNLTNVCPVCNGEGVTQVVEAEHNIWPELKKLFLEEGFTINYSFEDGYNKIVFYYNDKEALYVMDEDINGAYIAAVRVCLKDYGKEYLNPQIVE